VIQNGIANRQNQQTGNRCARDVNDIRHVICAASTQTSLALFRSPNFTNVAIPERGKNVMKKLKIPLTLALSAIIVLALYAEQKHKQSLTAVDAAISRHGESLVDQGRQIFRFDTFGDEDYWGGMLGLHQAIEGAKLGGRRPWRFPRHSTCRGIEG
jgi:hypothetical protein